MPKGPQKSRPAKAAPKAKPSPEEKPATRAAVERGIDRWPLIAPAILVLVTLICYWVPMTSNDTSILWDAADYHRPLQNYLSDELHAGRIPFWTPYPWAGYPFLADPQLGLWYPLNWPFFLLGISLHTPYVEHWLAALQACLGAYFLAYRLLWNRPGAVLAGLCYGLSGFFVGNAAHTGVLQTAACMPWLLLLLDLALESHALRYTIVGGLVAGAMILSGHFQTTLYTCLALGLFAAARAMQLPWASRPLRSRARTIGIALAIPAIGTFISAIATLPGLELTIESVRTGLKAINRPEGQLPLEALITLVYPNYLGGVISGNYRGPFDITQYYYYAGILMVPLAIAGWWNRALRWLLLPLIVVPIWYAMGPNAGLFLLMARLPGFSSVRAPVNVWFVTSLALAILAGAGFAALQKRWPMNWLPAVALAFLAADLFYFQSAANRLAYGRMSYQQMYGGREDMFRRFVTSRLPPLTRFEEPEMITTFGPLSHFLNTRTEVTNGYGPLRLARYTDYTTAMERNPSLRNGLNVSMWLDARTNTFQTNPEMLPRANFPKALSPVDSAEESKQGLLLLDQKRQALVPAGIAVAAQDGNGAAEVREYTPGHYRIHYRCSSASVLRVGNAWFPGWTAEAGGQPVDVFPVDHALLGVVVPAGENDVTLDYRSRYFLPGAIVTLLSLLACVGVLIWERRGVKIAKAGAPR